MNAKTLTPRPGAKDATQTPPKKEEKTKEPEKKEDEILTAEDLKGIVKEALKDQQTKEPEKKEPEKKEPEKKEVKEPEKKGLSKEDVSAAVKSAMEGLQLPKEIKVEDVVAKVKEALDTEKQEKQSLAEMVAESVKTAFEDQRKESKMEHPINGGLIAYPIKTRHGNISVADKQLLNIVMEGGAAINKDIPKDLLQQAEQRGIEQFKRLHNIARTRGFLGVKEFGIKALTSTGSGAGDELVPTNLSSDLLTRMHLASDLAARLLANAIDMPSNPYMLPVRTTRTAYKFIAEGGTPTESSPGTANVTLTAKKMVGKVTYSYEVDEDSIIPILPMIQAQLAEAAADAFEDALINGDTTATHQDSDTDAVDDHVAKAFKGFRKLALAGSITTDITTNGITADNIGAIRKAMGKYGINPAQVFILCGPSGYNDIVLLDETLTEDKVGARARITTGLAPVLFGMDIITSAHCRENLNASAVYDDTTTTQGSILLVHAPSWIVGMKGGFLVEVDRNISTQQNDIVASFRRDLQPLETPSTTVPSVSLGYNYTA